MPMVWAERSGEGAIEGRALHTSQFGRYYIGGWQNRAGARAVY
jgi:hypothetical protein